MKKTLFILYLLTGVFSTQVFSQTKLLDEIILGNTTSEKKHGFSENASEVVKGGLDESARILLPVKGERVEGGNVTFKMKVDPEKQNYFTARFWGSESGNSNILILFCEGKQIGYRHLGDYDMLSIANEDPPFIGRFIYTTLPLPIHMTKGKDEVELNIRSTGTIYRYGDTFEKYQKPMVKPTKGIYKGYTHTDGYFAPPKYEKQGQEPISAIRRQEPGDELLDVLKEQVNKRIEGMLKKDILLQQEAWFLADAYYVNWTKAYKNDEIIKKVINLADNYYERFEKDPKVVSEEPWATSGPLCIAIYRFAPEIRVVLDEKMENGKTRRENWSEFFETCINYSKTHRRSYTNQSMIVDVFMYHVNRVLSIVEPSKALPAYQTLKYLYESVGLSPWLGKETRNGPLMPLGKDYFQLTNKGLTKELGFVGGYGEIMNWFMQLYEATGEDCISDSRDPLLRAQMLKMLKARSYFRYPSKDKNGFDAMRAETLIGWRDHNSYPGEIMYGEKGLSRESTPMMTAAATLDPDAVAFARQMLDENQFFPIVQEKMKDHTVQSLQMLLRIPGEYERIKNQRHYKQKLPMSKGMPDFLFSDEEIGVIALKNGDEILYASLYWRANYAINFLARIHYITPEIDRVATVFQDVKFTDSGYRYVRPERVNLAFADRMNFYDVKSAHTGEELPIAMIPEDVPYKVGQESVHAGKGEFYTLRYGKYLIGMNCTNDKKFELEIPKKTKKVLVFPSREAVKEEIMYVQPMSTVVLIVE